MDNVDMSGIYGRFPHFRHLTLPYFYILIAPMMAEKDKYNQTFRNLYGQCHVFNNLIVAKHTNVKF